MEGDERAGGTTPDAGPVRWSFADGVGAIVLDNPAKRNALSAATLAAIVAALGELEARQARVAILRAAPGMKVWSAGHDVAELPRGGGDPLLYGAPLESALRALRTFPAPVIAMTQGSVWGAGLDLALSCDLVVADEAASFAITPANLGIPYDAAGLLRFLDRLPVNRIKELFFTAAPVDAATALAWGLVNRVVPAAEIEAHTQALAALIASKAPLAVAAVKEQLRVLADYQPVASEILGRIQDMRLRVLGSADYEEGINAFLAKRKPQFRGE